MVKRRKFVTRIMSAVMVVMLMVGTTLAKPAPYYVMLEEHPVSLFVFDADDQLPD